MHEVLPGVFVDTNVWISAFINPGGPPALILDAFRNGRLIPIVSQTLLHEIEDVLRRPRIRARLKSSNGDVAEVLELLKERGIEVMPTGTLRLCRDPRDDALLESAVLGRAQFAVSRDDDIKRDRDLIGRLRELGVEVLSVSEFLEMLA